METANEIIGISKSFQYTPENITYKINNDKKYFK